VTLIRFTMEMGVRTGETDARTKAAADAVFFLPQMDADGRTRWTQMLQRRRLMGFLWSARDLVRLARKW